MDSIKTRYELVADINKINSLRSLRDLTLNFSRYHGVDFVTPTTQTLVDGRYKALVCEEIDGLNDEWKISLMFKIGREKQAEWHSVICVDYLLINPSSRLTFTKVSNCVRLITQYAMKRLKASCVDLVINLDCQLNDVVKSNLVKILKSEGLQVTKDGRNCVKRLRNTENTINLPLPTVDRSQVKGMRPQVQANITPVVTENGDTVKFVGKLKENSSQEQVLTKYCTIHDDWLKPTISEHAYYGQTLFTNMRMNDCSTWLKGLINDAHFIVSVDKNNNITGFMPFIAGYNIPALQVANDSGEYLNPERTIFIPAIVCECDQNGEWTKNGLGQAIGLLKTLFRIISSNNNITRFDTIAGLTFGGGLRNGLYHAAGFNKIVEFSNLPYHVENSVIYARNIKNN